MRDYKHVKVPRSYRSPLTRTVTRRAAGEPAGRKHAADSSRFAGPMLVLIIAAALGYGGWHGYLWLTRAGAFQIAGVDVKGVREVSDEEVRALAAVFKGQNIFRVDLDGATRRALTNPWVHDVRIERRLPNRINIEITERIPRAVLQAANGRFLIDRDAVVIAPAGSANSAGLPTIAVRDLRAAPRSSATGEVVASGLELLDQLQQRGGWDPAAVTVRADSVETVAILYAGHEFRIGSGNYDEKLRRLGEIVTDMNTRRLEYTYVELRPERQAAVMVAKNATGRR
jgi:cell division septal protein FtsQ